MSAERFEAELDVAIPREDRRWFFRAALAGVVVIMAALPVLALKPLAWSGGVYMALLILLMLPAIAALLYVGSRLRGMRARVLADARGLFLNDNLVFPREEIRAGFARAHAAPGVAPIAVSLVGNRGLSFYIFVDDSVKATSLLTALRLDASRSVAHFPARAHRPTTVSVGADGVLVVESSFGRKERFHPFTGVAGVESGASGPVLVMKTGAHVALYRRAGKQTDPASDVLMEVIVERIRAGLDAFASAGSQLGDPAALLGRGARSYEAWRQDLRALARERSYRATALPDERLWRVLEDPAASASARAGAAVALRESLDGEGRDRLRVAAEASASPKVRVALEVIANVASEESELRAALETCDAEGENDDPPSRSAAPRPER
jgi:hypothetical protein